MPKTKKKVVKMSSLIESEHPSFSILLIFCVCLVPRANAQWHNQEAIPLYEGDLREIDAFSARTNSENGAGKELQIKGSGSNATCIFDIADTNGGSMISYLSSATKEQWPDVHFYDLKVETDKIEYGVYGIVTENISPELTLRKGNYRAPDVLKDRLAITKLLARASVFKITIPTREHGNLIYEFDMAGSYKAIQKVCPDLF